MSYSSMNGTNGSNGSNRRGPSLNSSTNGVPPSNSEATQYLPWSLAWAGDLKTLPSGQSMQISGGREDGEKKWFLELFQIPEAPAGRPRGVYAADLQVFRDGIAMTPEQSAISLPAIDHEDAGAYINTFSGLDPISK
jgi:hypothetical protein